MFRCSAHRLSQTRRSESLRCHSALCRTGPIRSRDFSSSVAAAGFTPTAPSPFWSRLRSRLQSLCLHSVTKAPSAGPARTSDVRCRTTSIQPSVPEPERPSSLASTIIPSGSCRACRLACSLSGSRRVERWDTHAPSAVHIGPSSHARSEDKSIFIGNGKHFRASATRFINIVSQFDILVIAINMPYATYVVKTCNELPSYAEISSQYSSF